MTVKECYDAMGADYEDVFARLRKDERIQKFLLKVIKAMICCAVPWKAEIWLKRSGLPIR